MKKDKQRSREERDKQVRNILSNANEAFGENVICPSFENLFDEDSYNSMIMKEFQLFVKDLRLYLTTGQGITDSIKLTSLAKINLQRKFKYMLSNHKDRTCMACVSND
jgi:hypothetical protein